MKYDFALAREIAAAHAEALLPGLCRALVHFSTVQDGLDCATPVVNALHCLIVAMPSAHNMLLEGNVRTRSPTSSGASIRPPWPRRGALLPSAQASPHCGLASRGAQTEMTS